MNYAVAFNLDYLGTRSVTFTPARETRVRDAIALWMRGWDSPEFKARVIAARFTQTETPSGATIYDTIVRADPKTLLYALTSDARGSETASTDAASGVTRLQADYLDSTQTDLEMLVNTLAHEYTHTAEGGGYTHKFLSWWPPWSRRDLSVPYQIGDVTEALARKMGGSAAAARVGT